MRVFEDGYARRTNTSHSIEYKPVKILDIGESSRGNNNKPIRTDGSEIDFVPCVKFETIQQEKRSDNKSEQVKANDYSTADSLLPITKVHDPKNQLSSLIKNARQNEESLKHRNERINKAKQRSKRQYGW